MAPESDSDLDSVVDDPDPVSVFRRRRIQLSRRRAAGSSALAALQRLACDLGDASQVELVERKETTERLADRRLDFLATTDTDDELKRRGPRTV